MKFNFADKEEHHSFLTGANNNVGFYPIGVQLNWHGGLHINEARTNQLKAIADGVIIAYRIGADVLESNSIKFSNSFVLIQHLYKSPKGREFTFYSLYNHLMPYSELTQMKKVPDIFKTQQYKIKGKLACKGKGIIAYKSISNAFSMILPVGSILVPNSKTDVFDSSDKHWAKNTEFKKVIFTDPNSGMVYPDLYIDLSSDQIQKHPNNTYKIIGDKERGKCWDYENLRSAPNWRDDNNVIMQVPNNSKCTISNEKGGYYEIESLNGKEQKGFIYAKSCVEDGFVLNIDENNLDKVITGNNCNIAVKAGDIIGFTGIMGHSGNKEQRSAHFEVFTATDPTKFLEGKEGDKDDTKTKNTIKLCKDSKLSLVYPTTFKANDEIEILTAEPDSDFVRIKLHKQLQTVKKADLNGGKESNKYTFKWYYTIKNYDKIRAVFGDTISKDSILVLNEDANSFKKGQTDRKVYYMLPNDEQIFWISKDNLPAGVSEKQCITLKQDLSNLLYDRPYKILNADKFPNDSDTERELVCDCFFNKSELKKINANGDTWYDIKMLDNKGSYKGIIKASDTVLISEFDWTAFGFKVLKDQPDTFIFDADQSDAPQFLQSVFKEMNTDGDRTLSSRELRMGLNNMFVCDRLSKMVCFHQSEWGVEFSHLKSEIDTFLDKGINKEEDEGIKNILIERKNEALQITEAKVNALSFWKEVKVSGNSMPEGVTYEPHTNSCRKMHSWETEPILQPGESPSTLEQFPTNNKVYHFHPNMFVRQMRRMSTINRQEAVIRALLRAFRVGEGTVGEKGYSTIVGGSSFSDHNKNFSTHPKVSVYIKNLGVNSDAAGAYQIMGFTYKWLQGYYKDSKTGKQTKYIKSKNWLKKYGINDFSPLNQDKMGVILIKHKRPKGWELLLNEDIENAINELSWEWASLPPGRYGQPSKSMKEELKLYNKYLEEELNGVSDLHLKNGFLDEFK